MILSFLSCQTQPIQWDAQAYIQNDCAAIQSSSLKGECLSFEAMAVGLPEGEKICFAIQNDDWKSECFFMISELADTLVETKRLCDRSTFLRGRCLSHWVRTEIKSNLDLKGDALSEFAVSTSAQIVGKEAAISYAERTLIDVLSKEVEAPFKLDDCHMLNALCPSIYLEANRQAQLKRNENPNLKVFCGKPFEYRKRILPWLDSTLDDFVDKAWMIECSD